MKRLVWHLLLPIRMLIVLPYTLWLTYRMANDWEGWQIVRDFIRLFKEDSK